MTDTPKKSRKGIGGRPKGRSYTEKIQLKLTPADREALDWVCAHLPAEASEFLRTQIHAKKKEIEERLAKEKLDEV